MKAVHLIRNTLLTGVCAGVLAGCSWLDDWPPKNSEMARKTAPKPPQSKVVQGTDATWLDSEDGNDGRTAAAAMDTAAPKGIAVDSASEQRIATLEKSLDDIRNDLQLMMPALTKLAAAQTNGGGAAQQNFNAVEPAAGGAMATEYMEQAAPTSTQYVAQTQQAQKPLRPAVEPPPQNYGGAPVPGSIEWYEQQEQMDREERQRMREQRKMERKAERQNGDMQQPYQPPQQQFQPQAQYQQPQYQQQQPAYQQANYQQPAYQPPQQTYQPQPQAYQQQYQPQPAYQQAPQQQQYQQQAQFQPVPSMGQQGMQQASYGGSSGPVIKNVRFGEHDNKTRLVFDSNDKVSFSYNVDNSQNLLIIDMLGTGWQTSQEMAISNSPLVSSYSVVPNGSGQQIYVQLKQAAQVLWAQALAPGGAQGHRVVFDIAAR